MNNTTSARINVRDGNGKVVSWFDPHKAVCWTSGTSTLSAGDAVWLTAMGSWVHEQWQCSGTGSKYVDTRMHTPFEPFQAYEWLIHNGFTDEAAAYFRTDMPHRRGGRPSEGRPIGFRLPEPEIEQLDILAADRHIDRAALLREIVGDYLARC